MSEMKSDDPWFIARDGAQHGPLNETEMKLFVDRGHLRATDLLWRQGFPDWRPAFSVFPPKTQPTQPPQPADTPTAQPVSAAPSRPQAPTPGLSSLTPQTAATAPAHQATAAPDTPMDEYHDDDVAPRWGRGIASTLIVGTLAGAGLWFFVHGPPDFLNTAGTTTNAIPVIKAPAPTKVTKQGTTPATPSAPARIDIDKRLQKAELWQFLKGQYPKWYANVLENAKQLDQQDNFDRKLSELLIARLIELRRLNAEKVLASSPKSLTTLASSFLDNLKDLAGRGPEPCYTFISKGEASPTVVEIMRKPGDSAPIHGQLLATFKASVEGTKSPVTRTAPQKSDYEALTGQLAKIGWNKEDIQLFANPKALSQAPPARVCQMVQDWFTAHLNLENAETQERLLYETLRPVVSG